MEASRGLDRGPSRPLSRTYTTGNLTDVMDPEIVPSSLAQIAPILRVANEVEDTAARVAYLCRFYAFDRAHKLDPSSTGRGVRQFKTALLHKLEKDDAPTLEKRKAKSDAREMQRFYQLYYDNYVKSLENTAGDSMDRAHLARTYQTAAVLFDVLSAVNQTDTQETLAPEIVKAAKDVEAKKEIYVAYNILPLDPASAQQAIMVFPEIKAAVAALRNTRGLPWPSEAGTLRDTGDLLDWLQLVFGFQKHNVANQREHLILLLGNVHVRQIPKPDPMSKLSDAALNNVMKRLFKNYRTWCGFLGRDENLRLPTIQQEVQQRKILYMGLYLLIWGEAANLRFMPESLCFIFHNMAGEVYGMLAGNVSEVTGENVKPAYGGEVDAFLNKVVTPIYTVIAQEVAHSKHQGVTQHFQWRNYDDLNEYFWSVDCFRLGWPMRTNADFFRVPTDKLKFGSDWKIFVRSLFKDPFHRPPSWIGKTNFVEVRSFWHIVRSFDRLWSFYILALQAMIIIAWNGSGSLGDIFDGAVFKKVLSIFITAAILRLMQAIVDIGLSFKAWRSMKYTDMVRYILKVLVAIAWVIILPVCYVQTSGNSNALINAVKNWFGKTQSSSLYITAIFVYLAPDALGALMFLLPMLRRCIERSNLGVIQLLLWWAQPPLYVGRGMHESPYILFKYTLFWILLLSSKFLFSYHIEVKPLVEPTKKIMSSFTAVQYQWHELFPKEKNNLRVVLALWAPIVMVYFMDTQIWYAVWSTIFGGINGAFSRLGEIRTLAMLRSRFRSLPGAFNANLVPSPFEERTRRRHFSLRKSYRPLDELYKPQAEIDDTIEEETTPLHEKHRKPHYEKIYSRRMPDVHLEIAKFTQLWNEIIFSFREEDYITDEEQELLLIPYSPDPSVKYVQWPPFLLANKIALALDIAKDYTEGTNDEELIKRVDNDVFLKCAIEECYDLFTIILRVIAKGERESKVIEGLIKGVEESIASKTLLKSMKMSALPSLYIKVVELVKTLEEGDCAKAEYVTFLLQDIYEVYTTDVLPQSDEAESSYGGSVVAYEVRTLQNKKQLFEKDAIEYPLDKGSLPTNQIKRLLLLLTKTESALDIPANREARRRIAFFTNSLFMDIPPPPNIGNMLSFSVLTPYFDEEILYTQKGLEDENEDGISILYYLQKIYPDEWNNFCKRTECPDVDFWQYNKFHTDIFKWASYRAQTLIRTVRGMMYYRRALELQAFFDMASREEIMKGYREYVESTSRDKSRDKSQRSLYASIQAIVDMKFTYVVTCQRYGQHKRTLDPRASDILHLMKSYPALRIAYIDEVEENKTKLYYSVLVKADDKANDQEIYRIKLPGDPILGEGKPENQNHAIIFTRGEALQAIDMNQDNYLEEALKMRNFLQEFLEDHGVGQPDILGMREHIFTGSVSSLAGFMSNQESSFVTIGQRVLANPLKVRFHYGHPDVFDRLFHLTRGGLSKASRGINLSEDIFAGFNTTLRRGNVTHHEYIQVGKGRDVGLNQISLFEAKIAYGNGEQTMSRDIYRLGHRVDFFRMLSVYFTTVGSYFSSLIVVLTVYVFLYGRIYLALSGMEASLVHYAGLQSNTALQAALASQSFVQIGLLMALPMVMEIGLEKGFRRALSEFIVMQLQLAPVFFTFSMGTKVHFYGRTLLHGGAKYKSTGRGYVVFHAKFAENYRLYSRSHFTKGLEILMLLIVYDVYGASVKKTIPYLLITCSLWFLVGTWLFAPFLFNPSGFEWQKIVDDWDDWTKWISNRGGIGVPSEKSWESWWEGEQEHLNSSGLRGKLIEIFLSLRFLIYQYGLVYHLNITKHISKSIIVYLVSWLLILFVLVILKGVSWGKQLFSAKYQLQFRLLKGLLFLSALGIVTVLFVVGNLTVGDVFACALAFLPSGWALVQIAQALKNFVKRIQCWDSVKALARGYEYLMGLLLFVPIATLAWFPFISDFQTRLLFNQAFSRGLQISRILAGRRERKMS